MKGPPNDREVFARKSSDNSSVECEAENGRVIVQKLVAPTGIEPVFKP